MICPTCQKEVIADRLFCRWCESYIPRSEVGTKASLARRFLAIVIDAALGPILFFFLVVLPIAGSAIEPAAIGLMLLWVPILVASLVLFTRGMTIGKWMLNAQVVEKLGGGPPGFARMLLREIIGKFVSSIIFGLGYFWAIWDEDGQAWHDKIAGTIVVKRTASRHQTSESSSPAIASLKRVPSPTIASRQTPVPLPSPWQPPPVIAESAIAPAALTLSPWSPPPVDNPIVPAPRATFNTPGGAPAAERWHLPPPPPPPSLMAGAVEADRPTYEQVANYGPSRSTTGAGSQDVLAPWVPLVPALPAPTAPPSRRRLPAVPRERAATSPTAAGAERGSRIVAFMIVVLAIVAVTVGGAGYWLWANPRVVFQNGLDGPVQVAIQGGDAVTVEARSVLDTRVPRKDGLQLGWAVRPLTNGDGRMAAATFGDHVTREFEASPLAATHVRTRAETNGEDYFAPRITNQTGEPLRIVVNGGLRSASGESMTRSCDCVVPAGATRFPIGYYRLFRNSTVRASAEDGATAMFEGFAESVDSISGMVSLRFAARDLRRPGSVAAQRRNGISYINR
ncbi:MAG: RDD family protein [Gemmatimonadaceae bacterium]